MKVSLTLQVVADGKQLALSCVCVFSTHANAGKIDNDHSVTWEQRLALKS